MVNIKEKNGVVILIVLLFIALLFNTMISSIMMFKTTPMIEDTNYKINYIYSKITNSEQQQQQQQQPQQDEFKSLSDTAKSYYEKLGSERVSGTPTWLIDGETYKGFDVQNKVVPEYGLIKKADIILFASPTCGYCKSAEDFMVENGIEFKKVCAPIHPGDLELCKQQGFIS